MSVPSSFELIHFDLIVAGSVLFLVSIIAYGRHILSIADNKARLRPYYSLLLVTTQAVGLTIFAIGSKKWPTVAIYVVNFGALISLYAVFRYARQLRLVNVPSSIHWTRLVGDLAQFIVGLAVIGLSSFM